MQLSAQELDAVSLAKLGDEVRQLLCAGDLATLAARFGYALAYDRNPVVAIREELDSSLAVAGSCRLITTGWEMPSVGYFNPNDTGLFALVKCLLPTESGASILIEVIVAGSANAAHATLEQVSAVV